MKLYRYFIGFLVLCTSCSDKNKVPAGVLSMQNMREVLWDMAKADRFVSEFVEKDSLKDKKAESIKLYEEVFALHKISRETFQKSLAFYESRPDLLKTVFDSLSATAKKAEQDSYIESTDVKKPVDSAVQTPLIHPEIPKKPIKKPTDKRLLQ